MPLKKSQVDVKSAQIVRREDYVQVLERIIAEGMCPFCEENVFKHHRKPLLFKNKYWLITTNTWPYEGSVKHFLLISRIHIEDAKDAPEKMWIALGSAYKKLCKDFKLKGATLMMRSGDTKVTGASVRHLHAQIIVGASRKKDSAPITALVGFKKKLKEK